MVADDPSTSPPRVCFVVMPFSPNLVPALGVSLLKSVLADAGVRSDVFYGSLAFHEWLGRECSPEDAVLLYGLVATYSDLGEHLFADALWGASGDDELPPRIAELRARPDPLVRRRFGGAERYERLVDRIPEIARRTPEFVAACRDARRWEEYDVVGFSSTFCQNVASLALAREIKSVAPNVHVVFGGANAEGTMGRQLLASFPQVDAVLQGEADTSIAAFAWSVAGRRPMAEVPGALFRDADGRVASGAPPRPRVAMDELPVPDFTDFFAQATPAHLEATRRHGLGLPIETSRGCWWGAIRHCVFCGLNHSTMAFRAKSPSRALAEFRTLRDRHGLRRFYASDNILDRGYVKDLLPHLEGEKFDIFYETKANLTEEEVARLARAGVRRIQPGIESLSSELLRLMRKGAPGHRNLELLKWCRAYDVEPLWFYMYGFAGEAEEPYRWILSVMDRLWHLPAPKGANPVTLDRYSPYFERRDEFGLSDLRPMPFTRVYYRGLDESERFELSYHFTMKLPQGNALPYARALHAGVARWQARAAAGAALHQFRGDTRTLVLDLRERTPLAYLLEGAAHVVHDGLRTAQTAEQREATLASLRDTGRPSDADASILRAARSLGAEVLPEPGSDLPLDRFLGELDDRRLVLAIDDRLVALAIECGSPLARLQLLASDLLPELPLTRAA